MANEFTDTEIERFIFNEKEIVKEDLGKSYNDFLLKQYSIYMELTDKQGSKRDTQNSFFLALHTLIISAVGFSIYYLSAAIYFPIILSLLGLCFAASWQKFIITSRILKNVSYRLIHIFESMLEIDG